MAPQAALELLPLARRRGVGVLARSPFAGGRLFREGDEAFAFLASGRGRSLTHAAIQYPLSHEAVSSVVTGVMRAEELEENVANRDTIVGVKARLGRGPCGPSDGGTPSGPGAARSG